MKEREGKVYLTIGQVAKQVDRLPITIKNWYEWAEKNNKEDMLPEMHTDFDAKGTRYFKEEDVPKLIEFRDGIKYGMLNDVSREKWGKRKNKIKSRD